MVSMHGKLAVLAIFVMAIAPSEGSSNQHLRKKGHDGQHKQVEGKREHHGQEKREVVKQGDVIKGELPPYPRRADALKRKLGKNDNGNKNKKNKNKNQKNGNTQQKQTSSTTNQKQTGSTAWSTNQQKQNTQKDNDKSAYVSYSKNCKAQGGKIGGSARTCDYGGQPNQPITMQTFPQGTFGTCQTMHPCLCGVDVNFFASRCPCQCRPYCGGKCPTKAMCPNGFAVRPDGTHVDEFDYSKAAKNDESKGRWMWYLGTPSCSRPW